MLSPSDGVAHQWDDKYTQAEVLVNTWCSAVANLLECLGLSVKSLREIRSWVAEGRSVTFRLKALEVCEFDREEEHDEDSKTKHVTSWKAAGGVPLGKRIDKLVHKIHEYFWNFSVEYSIIAFLGNSPDEMVLLQGRTGKHEMKTSSKEQPRPKRMVRDALDLNATWLLQQLADDGFRFHIDRAAKTTHTPRRNAEIDAALGFASEWLQWCQSVRHYLEDELFSAQVGHGLNLEALNDDAIFVPTVPLMLPHDGSGSDAEAVGLLAFPAAAGRSEADRVTLAAGDVNAFLTEQKRTLSEKSAELSRAFPDGGAVITAAEAVISLAVHHGVTLAFSLADGLQSIEEHLRRQLESAIGKEVSTLDFSQYMVFHGRKLFRSEYQPRPFSYAVRRPDHHPEGVVSIEALPFDGSMAEPIHTLVSQSPIPPAQPYCFQLNAASEVSISGDCYVHGWLGHVFGGESASSLTLTARARQFSSFLVLVGRIGGPGEFDPAYGMIVQNKTEMSIPLNLELIPPPGEFRDSIESLSPEQQQFAQQYRGMQLASTLFGVCVIQIKPHMEALLKLPNDSLTKEIRLTQTLLEMFIKYHIPSDLMSYGGAANLADAAKVEAVQKHVAAMKEMIASAKQSELEDCYENARMNNLKSQPDIVVREPTKSRFKFRGGGRKGKPAGRLNTGTSSTSGGNSLGNNNNNNNADPVLEEPEMDLTASMDFVAADGGDTSLRDLTTLPRELDAKFEALDEERAVRATIINVGQEWRKHEQLTLLGSATDSNLLPAGQRLEKQACYDLIDSLTKSGALPLTAQLHVLVAATHVFGESVMDTLVKGNVDPIQRVERSQIILASAIHQVEPRALLRNAAEVQRVEQLSPALFGLENGEKTLQ